MPHARFHIHIGTLTLFVIILALVNWHYVPQNANSWIAALMTMPFIWLTAGIMFRYTTCEHVSDMERKFFVSAVMLSGFLLVFSLAAKLTGHLAGIEPDLIKRAREIFMGLVLLYFGNMIPKFIGPKLKANCSNTEANSVRRFSGWALVLGALGYIGAWVFLPISQASNTAHLCVGVAIGLVIIRILIAIMRKQTS